MSATLGDAVVLTELANLRKRARMLDERLEYVRRFFAKHTRDLRPVLEKLSLEEQLQLGVAVVTRPGVACVGKRGPIAVVKDEPPEAA